jgi:thiol-disulfide isomerase/thioredoxin
MQFIWVIAALLSLSTFAAELGDPAAELKIAKWVKGEPAQVTGTDHNIYVVEFWATWCPPCRASIPHLTEIQKQFKDKNVIVVGVSDEKEETVRPFVKNMGSKMEYRVAVDENRKTGAGYMQAYGINGIPHAFVVQDKKVIWQGHPMAGLDKALEEITAGQYDLAKAKAKFKAEALYDLFRAEAAEGNDARADELANQLRAAVKDGSFPGDSFDPVKEKKELRLSALQDQFRGAVRSDDEKKASEFGKKLQQLDPSINLENLRQEVATDQLIEKYWTAISSPGNSPDQKKLGEQLPTKLKDRPELGNNVAWAMLTDKSVVHRDVPLALQISKQACEDSKWKRGTFIDTYARALFDSGTKEEAITYMEKAIAAAEDQEKASMERTLRSYKEGRVPQSE